MGNSVSLNIIMICLAGFSLGYLRAAIKEQIIYENSFRFSHGLASKSQFKTFIDFVKGRNFTKLIAKHAKSHNVNLRVATEAVAKQLRETENA